MCEDSRFYTSSMRSRRGGPRLAALLALVAAARADEPYQGTTNYSLDTLCNGLSGSCAADWCTTVDTTQSCNFSSVEAAASTDYAAEIAALTCKSCTQETGDTRCTTAALEQAIKTSAGTVKAAYCNDEYLVVLSDGGTPYAQPALEDVPQPPGGTDPYSGEACVTRTWFKSYEKWKFPLAAGANAYSLLPTASRYNNNDESSFPGGAGDCPTCYLSDSDRGDFGLPSGDGVGASTTGQSIFPVFNNKAELTPSACEVDRCNEHVGQGGGSPHFHGDPMGDGKNCLYNASDYLATDAHPPQIGWSFDGPSIFGRHLSTAAPGYDTALDDCGGHTHDSLAYHYHAQVKSARSNGEAKEDSVKQAANAGTYYDYPAFPPGPDQCYRGNMTGRGAVTFSKMNDYYKPCCGMTHYYEADGIAIDGVGTLDTSYCALPVSLGTGVTGGASSPCVMTESLASGATCSVACNSGYSADAGTTEYSCSSGTLTAATLACATSAAPTGLPSPMPTVGLGNPTGPPVPLPTGLPSPMPTVAPGDSTASPVPLPTGLPSPMPTIAPSGPTALPIPAPTASPSIPAPTPRTSASPTTYPSIDLMTSAANRAFGTESVFWAALGLAMATHALL